MGLFSFTQEIAMDLGTANTIIISNDKIVVDEPSVVALDRRTDKMIAVGEKAKMMYEKENPHIRTVRPLRDGVIADFNACEQMMRGLIKKVNTGHRLFYFACSVLAATFNLDFGCTYVCVQRSVDSLAYGRSLFHKIEIFEQHGSR